ncbi:hypothetical protein F5Y19DRAFT_24927 [Xylariaceae sp. FL1651]|nr:hypothetical protein F5Y19DRAFT_24927 [Xylariaceae sp. FL1651]
MFGSRSLLALVGWSLSGVVATEVVYVTDLSIFTVLAPCAQSALSEVIQYQTAENCPEAVTALQSCVCLKNGGNNLAAISNSISSSVDYSCGATASDDQASAATVLADYCNQASITPFPSPTIAVEQYVTELPAFDDLAPCAASGVSEILIMTYDRCPQDPSLLATCACKKNQNSLWASAQINTSVKYSCSSHTEDIASAQAVFAGYCGLVDGTTSFPETTDPPGDMTYYITALPQFSALAPCAQSAVSYDIFSQTSALCPSGPQALASCACLRDDMTGYISSLITSDVKYSCESTATEDVSSALDVWDVYCSAAKGLTTPAGITESISQAAATGKSHSTGPQKTGTQSAAGSSSTVHSGSVNGNSTSNGPMNMSTGANTAVIAGAVVGAVLGTALIAVVAFLIYRRSKKAKASLPDPAPDVVAENTKPELDSTSIAPPPAVSTSPSPSVMKNRMENPSPVSAMSGYNSPHGSELPGQSPFPPPPPPMPELHNQNAYPQTSELQGHNAYSRQTTSVASSQQVYEAPGQHQQPVHEAHGQSRSELQVMGWQSGPVAHAYEMDGGYGGQQETHAR